MLKITPKLNKSFENAHHKPSELKYLAYQLEKSELEFDQFFCNPNFCFLPLEADFCGFHFSLEDKLALSHIYFANFYSFIGTSEFYAIEKNMSMANKCFEAFSPDYMVMWGESGEEMDHISCFKKIHDLVFSKYGIDKEKINRTMAKNEDDQSSVHWNFKKEFQYFSLVDSLQNQLCPDGYGSFYLLIRYLGNIFLKKVETFLFSPYRGNAGENLASIASSVTRHHSIDEARHMRTSLEMGMELYQRSSKETRKKIDTYLFFIVNNHIKELFSVTLSPGYQQFTFFREALLLFFSSKSTPAQKMTMAQMTKNWEGHQIQFSSHEFYQSQKWAAKAIAKIVEEFGIKLMPGKEVDVYLNLVQSSSSDRQIFV